MTQCIKARVLSFEIVDCVIQSNKKPLSTLPPPRPEYMHIDFNFLPDMDNHSRFIITAMLSYAKKREEFKISPYRVEVTGHAYVDWSEALSQGVHLAEQQMAKETLTCVIGHLIGSVAGITSGFLHGSLILPFPDVHQIIEREQKQTGWESEEYLSIRPS